MTSINLLPWREELREERKKEFLALLVFVVIAAGGILLMVDRYFNSEINGQQRRNNYLTEQIAVLDQRLAEIRELRSQKAALTERMAVIQDLQGTRPVIVRLFDELARSLPEGVYYDRVSRTDEQIRLEGFADSNSRVSELMRSLDASEWFDNSRLQQVTAEPLPGGAASGNSTRNRFLLTVSITRPDQSQQP